MKKHTFEEEKVLILITSLMVWNRTPAKLREIKEGGGFAEGAEAANGEEGETVAKEGDEPPN